jgi:rod shape-determining protein MreD
MEPEAMTLVAAKISLLLGLALTLQHSLMADLRIGQVQPDLLLLVAVLSGIVGGSERGAVIGFLTGLLADLFLPAPMGLSALAFSLVGFATGGLQGGIIRSAWWIAPLTGLAGTMAGMLLYGVLGAMIGRAHFVRPDLALVAVGVAAMNAVLALPVSFALAWGLADGPESSYAR